MALLGLAGRIGSGKSTAGEIIQELYPEMNWQVKGFADKLRQVASLLTGIPAEDMKKQEVKEQFLGPEWDDVKNDGIGGKHRFPITLRTLLQRLGTQAIRDGLNSQSWVNALMCDYNPIGGKINHMMPGNVEMSMGGYVWSDKCTPLMPNWLITDCRFPNEVEAVKSRGGTCIRIVRPDNPYPQSNHESETALDGVELLTIINDGNIEQLRIKVKEILDPIVDRIRSSGAG